MTPVFRDNKGKGDFFKSIAFVQNLITGFLDKTYQKKVISTTHWWSMR